MPASHMRWCPSCESERDLGEVFCEGCLEKGFEPWPISQEPIRPSGWRPAIAPSAPPPEPAQSACPNGHPITAGDFICPECHIDIPAPGDTAVPGGLREPDPPPYEPPPEIETPDSIDGWHLDRRLSTPGRIRERFVATRRDDDRSAVLTLYADGHEPDPSVYALLQRLPRDHVPALIATGRWNDRVYDVCEHIEGGSLADQSYSGADLPSVRRLAFEIGSALRTFAEVGLRHRDLRPGNIHVRTSEPLDLAITGFGSARLSEFDLDIVAPLETTPYTAPEAVVGAVAPASDWWSLGMILLEQVTEGRCFDGINPRVFLVHALATGVAVPSDLPPELQTVLRGLLVRDRSKRWGWPQLKAWLDGEAVDVPAVACFPEVRPRMSFESGYFQSLEWRRGHGTKGTNDRGDHRGLA